MRDPDGLRRPIRTCVGCRRRRPDQELVRVGVVGETVVIGRGHPGRGAWICPDPTCVASATKKGAFRHSLRTNLADRRFADTLTGWLDTQPV